MSINTVALSGNLTRDAEYRVTKSGFQVLNFSIAVNERRYDQASEEWKEYPNYIDCAVTGRRAAALKTMLEKGMKVSVQGKLRWSQWEKDGEKRSKVTVAVDEVDFSAPKKAAQAEEPLPWE